LKKVKNGNVENQARNIIAVGTKIKGDIESDGDFRIEGAVVGTVKAKGKIVVGETGSVEGQIQCLNADISGNVQAKLDVGELTTLRASSKLAGDIMTKKISIEPGAIFSGSCQMTALTEKTEKQLKITSTGGERPKG
jgi:cytoskeletal protein CcmA (bactofilin family)